MSQQLEKLLFVNKSQSLKCAKFSLNTKCYDLYLLKANISNPLKPTLKYEIHYFFKFNPHNIQHKV